MTTSSIRLRFVAAPGITTDLIQLRSGVCMPICPSHVECVRPSDGKYVGAHVDGGFMARDPGYDKATPEQECFIDLPCTQEQHDKFYAAVDAAIGEPYDWKAILGFAMPGHFHTKFNAICSARMFLFLRDTIDWFPSHVPVCVPAHCIDPRDLLLMISVVIVVPH
jgi:hypothetical protein